MFFRWRQPEAANRCTRGEGKARYILEGTSPAPSHLNCAFPPRKLGCFANRSMFQLFHSVAHGWRGEDEGKRSTNRACSRPRPACCADDARVRPATAVGLSRNSIGPRPRASRQVRRGKAATHRRSLPPARCSTKRLVWLEKEARVSLPSLRSCTTVSLRTNRGAFHDKFRRRADVQSHVGSVGKRPCTDRAAGGSG